MSKLCVSNYALVILFPGKVDLLHGAAFQKVLKKHVCGQNMIRKYCEALYVVL